jgi:hypothetical protein
MDEEVIKIEVINSEGAKSSAPSIDPIPFSKIETCPSLSSGEKFLTIWKT